MSSVERISRFRRASADPIDSQRETVRSLIAGPEDHRWRGVPSGSSGYDGKVHMIGRIGRVIVFRTRLSGLIEQNRCSTHQDNRDSSHDHVCAVMGEKEEGGRPDATGDMLHSLR